MKAMHTKHLRGYALLIVFMWSGMILGISFLEAPLKFQAPQVTLAIGVGIGRLVFGTLNKLEIIFCGCLFLLGFLQPTSQTVKYLFGIIAFILLLQTTWLLPALDARAILIMSGIDPTTPSPHFYYVGGEVVKFLLLIALGLKFEKETVKYQMF